MGPEEVEIDGVAEVGVELLMPPANGAGLATDDKPGEELNYKTALRPVCLASDRQCVILQNIQEKLANLNTHFLFETVISPKGG